MSAESIQTLVDMGFNKDHAERAIVLTGNQGVEPAMEWLLAHSGELESGSVGSSEPEPIVASSVAPTSSTNTEKEAASEKMDTSQSEEGEAGKEDDADTNVEAKSLKCNDCGKLFKTQGEVEFHAAKTGHSDFSESLEEKKPLTEEEKAEQRRKIEEKLKQKRKEREEKEKEDALSREKERIRSGKEMVEAKRKLEEQEIRKMVELKRKEKEDDKKARERVRAQIEADKAARRAKAGGINVAVDNPAPPPTVHVASSTAPQPSSKDYTHTKLQIRLTNGQALVHTFGAKEALSSVRLYIEMNRTDGSAPFSLMTSFPKRVFSLEDFEKPLDVLGLVPSSVLIVSKVN